MVILGYRVKELATKTISETIEDNILGIAAQVAYNFFFSLFPLILFIAPLLSLVADRQKVVSELMPRIAAVFPSDAYALIYKVVTDVVFAQNAPGLISLGAVLAAWSGSNIFTTFMDALDTASDVKDERPWWKKRLIALGVLVGWALIVTAVTAILLAGDNIVHYADTQLGMGSSALTVWNVLQFPF